LSNEERNLVIRFIVAANDYADKIIHYWQAQGTIGTYQRFSDATDEITEAEVALLEALGIGMEVTLEDLRAMLHGEETMDKKTPTTPL